MARFYQTDLQASRRAPVWLAPLFLIVGLCIIAMALGVIHIDPQALRAPRWVLACTGVLFSLIGLLVTCQGDPPSLLARLLIAVFFSIFSTVFGWIGVGPGARAFSSTTAIFGLRVHSGGGEVSGRITFGAIGVIVALVAIAAWWSLAKALIKSLRKS
jgi:hypothetical protein